MVSKTEKMKRTQLRQQKRGAYERKRKKHQLYMKHTNQETQRFKRGIKQIKKDVTKAPEILGLKESQEVKKVSLFKRILKKYGKKKV